MKWAVCSLFFLLSLSVFAEDTNPTVKSPSETVIPAAEKPAEKTVEKESSDYEVDYEEEPGDEPVEVPEEESIKKKSSKPKMGQASKDTSPQGSRATNRFQSLLKSETKSIYKKKGKRLDVDSD
jgi:hypothetical protein